MKKFLTKLILSTVCTAALATCLVGCGDDLSVPNGGNGGDTTANAAQAMSTLRFDSKYYAGLSDAPIEERSYYIFSENGTGKFYFYYYYQYKNETPQIDDYTIDFKYVYSNANKTQVTCFYDKVTYGAKDNQKDVSTSWWRTLNVSENVLLSEGQYGYTLVGINEDYLDQIPNFAE